MPSDAYFSPILTRRQILVVSGALMLGVVGCAAAEAEELVLSNWKRTAGGEGGKVYRVTTLAANGPGSLAEACRAEGPRTVKFDVGGVIDLDRGMLKVNSPNITIDGESAPEPGITLIRGGIVVSADDVIIRHIRVRTGTAGAAVGSGWDCDSLNIYGARNVWIDHCSLSWGTDEVMSAGGPPFQGSSPAQWHDNTSHRIEFSNNLIAEGLSHSTHSEGEHSKGSLINLNVRDVIVRRNMFANNRERNPMFNGGTTGAVINNYIFNPGSQAIMLSTSAGAWGSHDLQPGMLAIIGNLFEPGPSTRPGLPLLRASQYGKWDVYMKDNSIRALAPAKPHPLVESGRDSIQMLQSNPFQESSDIIPSQDVREAVFAQVGARPSSRDATDRRLIADAKMGIGKLIDSQDEVGGYPRGS